jgi:hypothetical protein
MTKAMTSKPVKAAKAAVSLSKEVLRDAVKKTADKIVAAKQTNPGKVPYRLASRLVKEPQECIPKLNLTQGLQLANSLISGTSTEENVLVWNSKNSEVHGKMVDAGIACNHPLPVWKQGWKKSWNRRRGIWMQLIHPFFLVFVDKVGSNTSQVKD